MVGKFVHSGIKKTIIRIVSLKVPVMDYDLISIPFIETVGLFTFFTRKNNLKIFPVIIEF